MKEINESSYFRPHPIFHTIASRSLSFLADFFSDVEVTGLRNVPRKGGAIIIANHLSYFDPFVLANILEPTHRDTMVFAKAELFNTKWKHKMFTALGVIPVYRDTPNAADSLAEAIKSVSHGELVAIFPEGTISSDGSLLNFKTGAARLALSTGAPVIPISMIGPQQVVGFSFEKLKRRLLQNALHQPKIYAKIGAPLYFTGDPQDFGIVTEATQELQRVVNNQIIELLPLGEKPNSRHRMFAKISSTIAEFTKSWSAKNFNDTSESTD